MSQNLDNINEVNKFKELSIVSLECPVVEVEIITEKDNLVMHGELRGNIETSEMASDCLNVVTKRDMANDCPTFSITLIYKDKWFYEIGANDLVIIKIGRLPKAPTPVMFGLIDDIRKSVSFGNGKPCRTITLTGRGFGKGLVCFEAGAVKEVNVLQGSAISGFSWLNEEVISNIAQASATKAIELLIDNYVKQYVNYDFGNGHTYNTYMKYKPTENPKEKLSDASIVNDFQGSIWNLFKELQNAPFNEMFWEIDEDAPTLFVRPTPFNPDTWSELPQIELENADLIEDNIGRSDIETYTFFSVACRFYMNIIDQSSLGFKPLWYKPYYDKYGIKRLNVTSLYASYADEGDTEQASDMVTRYTIDLFNWNIKNNSMFNGTLIVKGDAKYKIGQRLLYKFENTEYYIESVTHSFSIYNSYTTQLAVTRGINVEERFSGPFGDWEALESMNMLNGNNNNDLSKNNFGLGGFDLGSLVIPNSSVDFKNLFEEAKKHLGTRYVWGGSRPETGFDCSGFVCYVFTQSGVYNLPRTTAHGIYKQSNKVSTPQPGDFVFYGTDAKISHIGIYIGNNQMIEAQGTKEKPNKVKLTTLGGSWHNENFHSYGRLSK